MLLLPWIACAAAAGAAETPSATVAPRTVEWVELVEQCFDVQWILPEDLPAEGDERPDTRTDLVDVSAELLALDLPAAEPGAARSFGDVVRRWRDAGANDAAWGALSARLARESPALARRIEPLASELLRTSALEAPGWTGDDDDPRDGLYLGRALTLARERGAPWSGLRGSKLVQQGCVLMLADPAAIKAAENDYAEYPRRPGASYEFIGALRGTYVRAADPWGEPSAALRIAFRCDLPFPYSHYDCELSILHHKSRQGRLHTDIHSKSRDFHWLAGRDVVLPVRASDGTWVASLVVRWFGFDLRGVPDGDDARRAGLRSSLGALKLAAEARYRQASSDPGASGLPRAVDGRVPEFEVRGAR